MQVNVYRHHEKDDVLLLSKEPLSKERGKYAGTLSNSTYLIGMPDKEIKEIELPHFLTYLSDRKNELIHDLDETDEVIRALVLIK